MLYDESVSKKRMTKRLMKMVGEKVVDSKVEVSQYIDQPRRRRVGIVRELADWTDRVK